MKTLLLLAILFLPLLSARALDRSQINLFTVPLQKACDARDIDGIKALYDFDGVPDVTVDNEVSQWEDFFDYLRDKKVTVTEVTFVERDAYLKRPEIDLPSVERSLAPRKRNGTFYRPNLDVVGFVIVTAKTALTSTQVTFRVGVDAQGGLKMVAEVRGK